MGSTFIPIFRLRQLLSTSTSDNTSDPSLTKFVQFLYNPLAFSDGFNLRCVDVYLCDTCDKDFDCLQDLITHEKDCGQKEVLSSVKPTQPNMPGSHLILGDLFGSRKPGSFPCRQFQIVLSRRESSFSQVTPPSLKTTKLYQMICRKLKKFSFVGSSKRVSDQRPVVTTSSWT